MSRLLVLSLTLGSLLGCDSAVAPSGERPAGTAGTVRGEVHYSGQQRGPLKIAVFTSFPPVGAPVSFQEFTAPVYPQPFVVSGVPSGRYFILAVVDVDPADGDRFRPAVDPGGAFGSFRSPAPVTVDAVVGAEGVQIELVDPSPDSPWSRPGYR